MDINKVVMTGTLIKDAEYKKIEYSKSYKYDLYDFAISVRGAKKLDNGYYESDIYNCEYWVRITNENGSKLGQYLKKGTFIALAGRIKKSQYTDKNGVNKTVYKIIAETLTLKTSQAVENPINNYSSNEDVEPVF